jgi:hypothetical protein
MLPWVYGSSPAPEALHADSADEGVLNTAVYHDVVSKAADTSQDELSVGFDLRNSQSNKSYDAVVFDVLRVSPEDFASQITLMDLPVFKAIQPDELASCAWTTKEKLTLAPNVVAFTRRFNHLNFLVQKEILSAKSARLRSDIMAHFIKVAKRLLELNNLHSVMAVLSALQSAPVYRLVKTWSMLSKKDRSSYEKLADLFAESNNRQRLRDYMSSVKLPCLPYLGCYLTDIVYIDVAHPHSGGMESEPRRNKMNNILRIISEFQQSSYDQLPVYEHIQNYLNSMRYIEELQKFVEDDNYKLSLQIEPPKVQKLIGGETLAADGQQSGGAAQAMSSRTESAPCIKVHSLCGSAGSGSLRPSYRKSKSLAPDAAVAAAAGIGGATGVSVDDSGITAQRHLLDDSVLDDSLCTSSDGSLPGSGDGNLDEASSDKDLSTMKAEELPADFYRVKYDMESAVKRKTLLKSGKKPSVCSWTRYWMGLWKSFLVYFPARCLLGSNREAFKEDPCKMVPVTGWMVVLGDNPYHPDSFVLTDPVRGNSYKFRAGTHALALDWCRSINKASKASRHKPPDNLISFE